ncbi:MAG: tRNA dihydrouridine synthase DusB [Chlamydiales bacterium]
MNYSDPLEIDEPSSPPADSINYLHPLQLGSLYIPSNIIYAPLAGCSNYPFRKASSLYTRGLFFCEMVKMEAITRYDVNTFHMLDYSADMHPIGAQLCGSRSDLARHSARILEDLGFDVIDLNCGCPVDKVTKDGSGSGLLKNLTLIGEILSAMVAAVNIPVTVKIRIGWDYNSIVAAEITRIAEQAGAKAIFIHGRTREQGYKGPADWKYIKQSKEVAHSIKVIGNGDAFCGTSSYNLFKETNCDGILLARGTLGAPWLIKEIESYIQGTNYSITEQEMKQTLLQHLEYIRAYMPPEKALTEVRKIGAWYLRKDSKKKELYRQLQRSQSIPDCIQKISEYTYDSIIKI